MVESFLRSFAFDTENVKLDGAYRLPLETTDALEYSFTEKSFVACTVHIERVEGFGIDIVRSFVFADVIE